MTHRVLAKHFSFQQNLGAELFDMTLSAPKRVLLSSPMGCAERISSDKWDHSTPPRPQMLLPAPLLRSSSFLVSKSNDLDCYAPARQQVLDNEETSILRTATAATRST